MNLDDIRRKIDMLDADIVRLLCRRAEAGREAGRLKTALGLPLRNPDREREVLARLAAHSDGSMPAASLTAIYRTIIAETLAQEEASSPAPRRPAGGKADVAGEVLDNVRIAPGFWRMRVRAPTLAGAFRPGQFFQLRIDPVGDEPLLRRPFAPSETAPDGFSFVYAVAGRGTGRMTALPPGTTVAVLAPLGNAFTPPPADTEALLVGGGCGAPSLGPLARRLHADGVRFATVIGARSAGVLLERRLFQGLASHVACATDDGSEGHGGTVVDLLASRPRDIPARPGRVYACGPLPMLRAVAGWARDEGLECEVSLEARMACGFGACMGCVIPVRNAEGGVAYRRVCHDGPVFDARKPAWEEMP